MAPRLKVEEESEVEECSLNKLKWGIGMLLHEHAESFVLHLLLGEVGNGLGWGRARKEEFQVIDMFSSYKRGPVLRFRRRG
jgi:hypothetical protein